MTEDRLTPEKHVRAEQEMARSLDSISCGLCIYRIEGERLFTLFRNQAFYDIMGFSQEKIRRLDRENFLNVHPEDLESLKQKIESLLQRGGAMEDTYRLWNDKGREYRWIHLEATLRVHAEGWKLFYGVYSDVSEQERLKEELTGANERMRETQRELDHLINSIPGGIVSYRVENGRFLPAFFTDGTAELSGFTREEYEKNLPGDALDFVYDQDLPRVRAAALAAVESGEVLDISYRTRHKNGNLVWVHLNGRRMGPRSESPRFYAVLTKMLSSVGTPVNENADGVYVIDKNSYELLYINESKRLAVHGEMCLGNTCYTAIHGLDAPCPFCTLKNYGPDDQEHEITVEKTGLVYAARVRESVWNGIPAYIMCLRDVTEEARARREKERLELYFQTLVRNLPGGIAVLCCTPEGGMVPEYISEGFASMLCMTVEEVDALYRRDAFAAIHPEEVEDCRTRIGAFLHSGQEQYEFSRRFRQRDGSYRWIRVHVSQPKASDGVQRLYCVHTDIDQLMDEKERMRRQYEELILQHYRTPGPDTLVLGHCNITQNKILEIRDFTGSRLLETFGQDREEFFTGFAGLIVEEKARRDFLDAYLNAPSLKAFARGDTEQIRKCFIQLPGEPQGRYAEFQMNLVETPDTGDITGILSVTDVTDRIISDQILRRLSVTSHDYVIDLDLSRDAYTLLTCQENASRVPASKGCHSKRVAFMAELVVVPKDRETYAKALAPQEIMRRLGESDAYTFTYSVADEGGCIRMKNMTVSAIDLRLGRVSLVCTDITSSVREQQNLLNVLASTFEMTGMIHVRDNSLILYTREMVLENLPPFVSADYRKTQEHFVNACTAESQEEARRQFSIRTMLARLCETPSGYKFILPFQPGEGEDALRYKQISVLWGDRGHETICMVRADVTEALAAERQAKNALEKALATAREASRAKSDFLSAMSHDIRTPMNAIMGMAALAPAHLDNRAWMEDCLKKITLSSKHLLSLINDVLDMSRIEREQIALHPVKLSIPELTKHLSAMMEAQARDTGIEFAVRTENISHPAFYGDSLRINQILINLLSNAIKFTPRGGRVDFLTEELPARMGVGRVCYRFTIRDTGIGMSEEFLRVIFEPFIRENSAAQIEGTGLGLSIVHGLVEQMQGEIAVESQPGKGSTFRVEMEFEAAEEELASQGSSSDSFAEGNEDLFAGRRFLVAEDNALNAEILCEILQGLGARMDVRSDGAQALQLFERAEPGTYDAILMDIQMPNMNGYEAARAIRALKRPDAKAVPIIALTANAFTEDIRSAAAAGMTAHVAKPIDLAVLQATLNKALHP